MSQTTQPKQQTMQAIALDHFGGPETMQLQPVPVPEVGPDDVLIRVEAAGVGIWDPMEREGKFVEMMRSKPTFPYVLGSEGAGRIATVGSNVDRFKPGERVYGISFLNPKGGFYAEYVATSADLVSHIPGKLTTEQAAVFSIDSITALRGLDDTLRLQPGESVLIFGASGGLGHLAVQLAKRMKARVFAVASGADGVALAQQLGADVAVDGRKDDVGVAAREFAPAGIDTALVTVGGAATDRALTTLRSGGRAAYPTGVTPEPKAPSGVRIEKYDGIPDREIIERLNRLVEAGPFEVSVARTFPLEQAVAAQQALGEHHLGKYALQVS